MKATPGPWNYDAQDDHWVIYNPNIGTIATTCDDMRDQPANARLIAAAPELLTALIDLVEAIYGTPEQLTDAVRTARDVIRKTA